MTGPARVAILGNPAHPDVEWSAENLRALVDLGFTAVQLNIAWSYRPLDEPLNLEDVWDVAGPVASSATPGRLPERQADLRRRSELATEAGLRTLFHFGAPFQGRAGFDGAPLPQCISDPATGERYAEALAGFAGSFPLVEDLLVYTYDQDAWLCSEFGDCDRCAGVPLHERLPRFLDGLAASWADVRPTGRVWWEPWELSSGQTFACIERLAPGGIGLMMHSSIAEVISTMPADRFLRSAAALAASRGIPVIAEAFLSSANEEVEPWENLPVPLVTIRQLRALDAVDGVVGVKEYYGIVPEGQDVNLAAAAQYFADPDADEATLLARLADRLGGPGLAEFWTLTSSAYEQYPWDATWFARQLGRSQPVHALSAATVRGSQSAASAWETPAWRSSRGSVFMRTTNDPAHPWLLEDVELRCRMAARTMERAVARADQGLEVPALQLSEAVGFITRATALALHIRATTLADRLRSGGGDRARLIEELRDTLREDLANQRRELDRHAITGAAAMATVDPSPLQLAERWVVEPRTSTAAIEGAIALLDDDVDEFLRVHLLPAPDAAEAGQFSLTSR